MTIWLERTFTSHKGSSSWSTEEQDLREGSARFGTLTGQATSSGTHPCKQTNKHTHKQTNKQTNRHNISHWVSVTCYTGIIENLLWSGHNVRSPQGLRTTCHLPGTSVGGWDDQRSLEWHTCDPGNQRQHLFITDYISAHQQITWKNSNRMLLTSGSPIAESKPAETRTSSGLN